MLATQFLNVVLEEKERVEEENLNESCENNNNFNINYILSQLDIKSQLAKILLSECTIEPSKIAQKREKPVLRFEANVTPIYDVPVKKPKTINDEFALNAVEAVYSDGEEDGDLNSAVPCPVCNRSFSRNCSLAIHLKSHDPMEDAHKRFQCQLCPRSYSQKSVLKKHLSVHTGERERCKICGAGFSQRSSLVRHAKRIHGGLIHNQIRTPPNPTQSSQLPVTQHASISTQTSNSCVLLVPNNGHMFINNVLPSTLKPSVQSSVKLPNTQPSSSVRPKDHSNVHHIGVP